MSLILLLGNWKKKLMRILGWGVSLFLLAVAVPFLFMWASQSISVFHWFEEDRPTGNPMRVERLFNGELFNEKVDQLVFHIQGMDNEHQE